MRRRNAVLVAAAAACLTVLPLAAQERISIGTGGTGGLFYVIGAGMADILNRHLDGVTARAEVTGASVENIRRVAAEQMTFGFASSSTLYEASTGEGPFQQPLPVAAIAYLYPAVLQIATVEGRGIESIADLAGRRINLGPPGSNAAVLAQRVLEAYGVFDVRNARFLSFAEGTAAMINRTVEATVVLAGAPTAALIDLAARADMRLLPLDETIVSELIEAHPYYQLHEIPAGTYSGQTSALTVINDPATLFTKADAPDALIHAITRTLFDHLQELHGIHPQAAAITRETATRVPVPLHPGAERYFNGSLDR